MHAIVLDLETTGVDIHACEVVQCALLEATLPSWEIGGSWTCLARPRAPIPSEATNVHKITDEMVRDSPHFSERADHVREVTDAAELLVSFNGAEFDLPIMRRVLGLSLAQTHLDVYRVWQVAREDNLAPGTHSPRRHHCPGAKRFTGALGSAWSWITGREPTEEHDAAADCKTTALVAEELVRVYGLEICLAWTTGPLPGCVDYAGKIRWDEQDRACMAIGKHKGSPLAQIVRCDRHYLMWILRADFHEGTKQIVRDALVGKLPIR